VTPGARRRDRHDGAARTMSVRPCCTARQPAAATARRTGHDAVHASCSPIL